MISSRAYSPAMLQRWTLLCPWCEWVGMSTAANGEDELEHLVADFMRHVIDEHRGKEALAISIKPTRLPDS